MLNVYAYADGVLQNDFVPSVENWELGVGGLECWM